MATTSNKASSLTKKASAVVTLLIITIVAGTIFTAPSLSMAQQQQQQQQTTTGTATTTAPTTPSLTPKEQQEQVRMQRTTAAITQNLEQGQKQVNGIVYTPRWSEPVWVQPNSLSLLFVYCLPGEFAESGQHILGGSDLEVLESYVLAITNDLSGWLIVVENENENARLPAAVGVICESDANDPQTRILSQQEQVEINNIIQQFITIRNTVINNVTQVINIINNVTTNGTGGGGGVIPTAECPQGTVFNSTTQECESENAQNVCKEPGFELVNGVCQKPADLSCSEGELVGRDCRYLEESISPVCPAGSTEQATGFCTDDITGEVVKPICEGPEYVLEGGNNLRTAKCNLYVTVLAEASCSEGVLDEDRAICQMSPEPLTVVANWDSTNGDTAPATYRMIAETGLSGTPPYTYHWDFGDGQQQTTEDSEPRHTYGNPGNYTATVTVTDAIGQTASDSRQVTVRPAPTNDTLNRPPYFTQPVITGADDITVEATSSEGATVSFEVSAEQDIEGEIHAVPVSCDHESGETFPIGETVVSCTAQGLVGDATQESFTIRVEELPLTDGEAESPTNDTGGQ